MKVYFSHGKESGPWGTKIKRLATLAEEAGCAVTSVDYTLIPDPDERVAHLQAILAKETEPFVLVGSSMGGYVSLVTSGTVNAHGVFLLAPALYMPDYDSQEYPLNNKTIEIVHGWSDDIIPAANSIRYAEAADCTLHLISGDHRLNISLNVIEPLFLNFLTRCCNK